MLARSSACLQNAALQFGFEHLVLQPILLCKLLQLGVGSVLALGYLRRYALSGTQWHSVALRSLSWWFREGRAAYVQRDDVRVEAHISVDLDL